MPQFSVIIPAFNQAQFLTDAVQSVLDQTCADFEVIVVNDASPDNTDEVMAQFTDPRVKYLVHEKNKGLPGARNTGMRVAAGEYIALLDSDDYFHPEKLAVHLAFYQSHPEIDITYNARYELRHSTKEVRTIYQPPATVSLADALFGFPFSPSDMVLRRTCLEDVGLFDDGAVCGGEDLDYPCRLALAGKQFARVEKVLNYRRFHSGRKKKKLDCRIGDYTKALSDAFNDPRFPPELASLRPRALASHYSEVASWALCQEEYELGNHILHEIQSLDPAILSGQPAPFVNLLIRHTTRDWHNDHEQILTQVFANLDAEFQHLAAQLSWAITTGYLQRGAQEIIWNHTESGLKCLARAKERQAVIEPVFLEQLSAQLVLIRLELGAEPAQKALDALANPLRQLGGEASVNSLRSTFAFNSASGLYRTGQYGKVAPLLMQAAKYRPGFLANRGFYAMLVKSLLQGKSV